MAFHYMGQPAFVSIVIPAIFSKCLTVSHLKVVIKWMFLRSCFVYQDNFIPMGIFFHKLGFIQVF